jgi:hypothetical protein
VRLAEDVRKLRIRHCKLFFEELHRGPLLQQASLRVIQQTLRRIGIHVTPRAVGSTLSRWLPAVGPILIGGYSMMDTRAVGKTAIDAFGREIEIEPGAEVIDVTEVDAG